MAVGPTTKAVAVLPAATLLVGTGPARTVKVQNISGGFLAYIGGSASITSNGATTAGFPLAAASSADFPVPDGGALYACGTGTVSLYVYTPDGS